MTFSDFLELNKDRKVVAVQGLGFVGAVMSLVIANSKKQDYAVIGVDLPNKEGEHKVAQLNKGIFPIKSADKKVYDYLTHAIKRKNFFATTDNNIYSLADTIIVDINLDVKKDSDRNGNLISYNIDIESFKDAIQTIASKAKPKVLVIIESTVPPGTTEKIVKPIFEEEFDKRNLEHSYMLAHSYERVMPGSNYINSIENFYRVFAGIDKKSTSAARKFLETIINIVEYPLTQLSNTNASEMAKVLENSFRAMNIAFIQEWTEFAENAGVNLFEVINAIRMRPTHKNIMYPGLGVGGYCLTKDPLLASWSHKNIFNNNELNLSENAVKINDKMPLHSFKIIKQSLDNKLMGKKVLLLGVSYLNEVGDSRFTPVKLLFDKLTNEEAEIYLHDPFLQYWHEAGRKIENSLENVLKEKYDLVALTTAHKVYKESEILINYFNTNDNVIVDTNMVLTENQISKIKHKYKLKIIGRGDIN